MSHHDLATLARYHERYVELEAKRLSLAQQEEALRDRISTITKEQVQIMEEVRAGVPEPSGNRWEPVALTGEHPEGLFRVKRETRRQADDERFNDLVHRYPNLLEICNGISVTIPGDTALLVVDGSPASRTALGDFVAAKIGKAKKKASKMGLEKALDSGKLPSSGAMPKDVHHGLADIYGIVDRVVVEPVVPEYIQAKVPAKVSS